MINMTVILLVMLIALLGDLARVQADVALTNQPSPHEANEAQKLEIDVSAMRASLNSAHLGSMLSGTQGALSPRVNLIMQLGVALQRLNHLKPDGGQRIPEAIQSYKSVLEVLEFNEQSLLLNADTASQLHGNIAALYLDASLPHDALRHIERGIEIHGRRDPNFLFNMAKAYSMMGKVKEADEIYAETASISHGKDLVSFAKAVAAMENLTDVLLHQTEVIFDEAMSIIKERREDRSRMIPEMTNWISLTSDLELSWIGFGIFKARDRREHYDRAWTALDKANKAMKKLQPEVDNDIRTFDVVTSVFKGRFETIRGYEDRSPIFVTGLPRSGSTLIEQILSSHSKAWGAGEDTLLAPLTPVINSMLAQPGMTQDTISAALQKLGKQYVDGMRQAMIVRTSNSGKNGRNVKRIVDKMLRNLWLVGYIDLMLPKSVIIHIKRHPMDAAMSCYGQPFGYAGMPWAWDLKDIAHQINMTFKIAKHWDQYYPNRVITVFYEELVSYPKEVAAELLKATGLPWEDSVVKFYEQQGRSVATASMAQVRRPMYYTSIGRWKSYASHLEPLREMLGGTIAEYEKELDERIKKRTGGRTSKIEL